MTIILTTWPKHVKPALAVPSNAGAVHGLLTAQTAEKAGGEVGCLRLDLECGLSNLTWPFLEKLLRLP
jgi:hypothetical protein